MSANQALINEIRTEIENFEKEKEEVEKRKGEVEKEKREVEKEKKDHREKKEAAEAEVKLLQGIYFFVIYINKLKTTFHSSLFKKKAMRLISLQPGIFLRLLFHYLLPTMRGFCNLTSELLS